MIPHRNISLLSNRLVVGGVRGSAWMCSNVTIACNGAFAVGYDHRVSGKLPEAETDYSRTAAIYRAVYGDQHQNTAIALSHLAEVYLDEGQYARAEHVLREVIQSLSQTVLAGHYSIGMARVKLARALLREKRYLEAESEGLAGYEILKKTTSPANKRLPPAREELVTIYDSLHQPEKAARFRSLSATAEIRKCCK